MKTLTKSIVVASLIFVCVLSLFLGVHMLTSSTAIVADASNKTIASSYFYDNLYIEENGTKKDYALAKEFYKAFDQMNESDDFKDGKVEYNITEKEIVTSQQIKAWVEDGDLTVPKAFSAARDAFLSDHPEIFYIDFYKLTISAGRTNGVYSAFIDSGREANLFYDNGFNTVETVSAAIKKFEDTVNKIVAEVNGKQNAYSAKDAFLAKEVNKYLAENIKYDYVTYENRDDENYIAAANVSTAYGGIVEGKAICSGFSKAYKVILDALDIPCITVHGYSNQRNEYGEYTVSSVYHMWNYVYLNNPADSEQKTRAAEEGRWYSVDVTWNSSSLNRSKYSVLNSAEDAKIHVIDGVISSSKYELTYPALSTFNYGATGDTNGIQASFVYQSEGDGSDDVGGDLISTYATVSYNGKSAKKLLEEDGLYLSYRYAAYINDVLVWQKWIAIEPFREFFVDMGGGDVTNSPIRDDGTQTTFYENTSVYYMQFAVFDVKPDVPTHIHSDTLGIDKEIFYLYSDELINKSNSVEISDLAVNETYGTYTAPPYVSRANPSNQAEVVISDSMRDRSITDKVMISADSAFVFEITYDEELYVIDPTKPIGISFVSDHPNAAEYAKFFPLDSKGTLVELVERAKTSNDSTLVKNTLRFKFGPSLMYEHNRETYTFMFTNVGSAKLVKKNVNGQLVTERSGKTPMAVPVTFGRLYMACPARFNYDGRLWVECCAQPVLADNSDLSATDFKKEDGTTSFSENERSQMMLVAQKVDSATETTMKNEILSDSKINLEEDDIKTSSTYDINLQICGKYPTIPDGSYVKIMLGFPEGFGPQDEGVTFKLFHRKHDQKTDTYSIEEVPCVVTQFGIVATVTSFSPYMVAAVDASKVTDKTVYASIDGKGGKLNAEDGQIRSLKSGESYTYTIKPDSGYQVYSVTLNGKSVTDQIKDGKLTVSYDGLEGNNELEIRYIADEAVQRTVENNIVTPAKVVVTDGNTVTKVGDVFDTPTHLSPVIDNGNGNDNNGGNPNYVLIAIAIVAMIAIVALVTTVIVLHIRKKAENNQ